MNHFFLKNQKILFDELLQKDIKEFSDEPYALSALTFITDWLKGNSEFEIPTSGSTGTPKKILIHKEQMVASAKATIQFLGLQPEMKALICINTEYIGGKMMLVRSMLLGMEMHIYPPTIHFGQLSPIKFDFAALVPLQVEKFFELEESGKRQLEDIHKVIIGGAAISPGLRDRLKDFSNDIYSTFGMTETLSHFALQKLSQESQETTFSMLPGYQIGVDEEHCLWVAGLVTKMERIQTNDVVNLKSETTFEWLGRRDFVINSGGIKIHPERCEERLEKALSEKGISCQFIFSGLPDDKLGQKLIVLVEEKIPPGFKTCIDEVFQGYEKPKEIIKLDSFRYTENHKINRIATINSFNHA